jgi:translation initiation factor 3 subunit G
VRIYRFLRICNSSDHIHSRPDWADDEELDDNALELPPQQITTNKDGTKTIITWRFNEDGKKVKTTRRIRTTVVKEVVNPRVAERKSWSKFGLSSKDKPGPAIDTTSVGENIIFKPSVNWRKDAKEEKTEVGSMKDKLKDKKVKCRICNGEHFTARCPFKDTMAPVGEEGAPESALGAADAADGAGALGSGKSSYVPPHLRNRDGAAVGDRMGGGKYERDDLATLRVTNVSLLNACHICTC